MFCGIRKLRSEYYTKTIEESTCDLKATWKILKEVINKGQETAEINKINVDSQTITDKKDYLGGLTSTFCLNQREVGWGDSGSSFDFQ